MEAPHRGLRGTGLRGFREKSDVRASDEARAQYRRQVRIYQRLVGAARGLVVYATGGEVEVV